MSRRSFVTSVADQQLWSPQRARTLMGAAGCASLIVRQLDLTPGVAGSFDPLMTMHLPLESNGPHAELQPDDQLFAPFIGSWDLEVTWYDGDVVARRENGEWHFAWVLEGRAIQDVWIVPRREARHHHPEPYEYGTSVRFHDPTIHAWRSTWIGPTQHRVRTFVARRVDEDVQLETRLDDGRRLRWTFTEIGPDSFRWTNATEADGRWLVTQRFTARRAPTHRDNR